MESEKWQLVKRLFAESIETERASRPSFLNAACGNDDELHREIESLLAEYDETSGEFERNAVNFPAAFNSINEKYAGRAFGHFSIIREIGSGGMGTVFLAERSDGEFEQKIALKVIRTTLLDKETERRFRRERQILANLNHPHIAKLLDGGISLDGEPYLAMEYVEGQTLLDFANVHDLSPKERLQIFLKICSAVSYAHQNLTIHRDIKPTNILVPENGEPKLLDFGLAKILDENLFETDRTATAYRAFTPAYASPEQFLGKSVTTLTDVYSLGVVLYELLTGRKPFDFDGRSLDEIIRTLSDDTEPPMLSETKKLSELKGDLDNIAAKALQKEPDRRYRSVEELMNDIDRYLCGLPVSARPATLAYRTAKLFRRNKIVVSAAAVVFLSLFAALIITLWQFNETRKERDLAQERFNDVRRLSNSLLFEIAPSIERLSGSVGAREIIISRAIEYLDNLALQSQNDLQLQAELASAYQKIGDLQGNPANPNFIMLDEAIKNYEKSLAIRNGILEKDQNNIGLRHSIADSYRVLGKVYGETNDYEAEQDNLKKSREILEELLGRDPTSVEIRRSLARSYYDAGVGQTSLRSYGKAIPFYNSGIDILEAIDAAGPDPESQRILANCYAQKGYSLSWESRQDEAIIEMSKAITIHERLAAQFSEDAEAIDALWLTYWLAGNINEEIDNKLFYKFQQKAERLARLAVEGDPSDIRSKQRLAKTLSHLGQAANNIGRPKEALEHLQESSRIYQGIIENESRNGRLRADLAGSLLRLGIAKNNMGNVQAALTDISAALEIYIAVNKEFPNDKRTKNNLATAYGEIAKLYDKNQAKLQDAKRVARDNYQRALELMLEMESQQDILSTYDLRFLEEMKAAVQASADR